MDGACIPCRVHTVVMSVQHSEDITLEEMQRQLKDVVIKVCCIICKTFKNLMMACITLYMQKVIPAELLTDETIYHLQPSGKFTVGGPKVIIQCLHTKETIYRVAQEPVNSVCLNRIRFTLNCIHRVMLG